MQVDHRGAAEKVWDALERSGRQQHPGIAMLHQEWPLREVLGKTKSQDGRMILGNINKKSFYGKYLYRYFVFRKFVAHPISIAIRHWVDLKATVFPPTQKLPKRRKHSLTGLRPSSESFLRLKARVFSHPRRG